MAHEREQSALVPSATAGVAAAIFTAAGLWTAVGTDRQGLGIVLLLVGTALLMTALVLARQRGGPDQPE